MASYRPINNAVTEASITNATGSVRFVAVKVSTWGLVLVKGIASTGTGVLISNSAIEGWYCSTSASATGTPNFMTFTDKYSTYGVTVPAAIMEGKTLFTKVYQNEI